MYTTAEQANEVAEKHVSVLRKDDQYCGLFSSRLTEGLFRAKCGGAGDCDIEIEVWVTEGEKTEWPSDEYLAQEQEEEEDDDDELPIVEQDVDVLA